MKKRRKLLHRDSSNTEERKEKTHSSMNLDLLFSYVSPSHPKHNKNGKFEINLVGETEKREMYIEEIQQYKRFIFNKISFNTIHSLISNLNYLLQFDGKIRFLKITIQNAVFVDTITAWLFALCIEYFNKKKPFVALKIHVGNQNQIIHVNDTFFKTPINLMNSFHNKNIIKDYYSQLQTTLSNNKFKFFIKIINSEDNLEINTSIIYQDVSTFLTGINVDNQEFIDDISEIVAELVGNALEHSKAPTLLYIHRHDSFYYTNEEDKILYERLKNKELDIYTINLICLSDKKIYDGIMNKFEIDNQIFDGKILKSYENHTKHFDNQYTKEHFFTLTAMQPRITEREDTSSGGIGLPTFIQKISKYTLDSRSYVASGKSVIHFIRDSLGVKFNEDKSIVTEVGLNDSGNYYDPPNFDKLSISPLFINGIIYNIMLVVERKDENNDKQ